MKYVRIILKILGIALILFLCKHAIQAFIEFTYIIPVKPRAYIWGEFKAAKYTFIWQFVFSFWVYILAIIAFYFLFRTKWFRKLKSWIIISFLSILIFFFVLIIHKFEFPLKQTYFPTGERFNFGLIEDFIIYTSLAIILFFANKKWLVKG